MNALTLLLKMMKYEISDGHISVHEYPPKQLKLTQIISLAQALGYYDPLIPAATAWQRSDVLDKIHRAFEGKVMAGQGVAIKERVLAYVTENYHGLENRAVRPMDLNWMFRELYNYRKGVIKLQYSGSAMQEGFSGALFYAQKMTGDLSRLLDQHMDAIDSALWELVDPEKRTLDALPEGYPEDAAISSAESDWFMENF